MLSSLHWDLWSIFSVCPLFPSWPPSQTPTRLQWFVPGCHSDLIPLWLRVLPYRSRIPRGRTPWGTQFFCPGSNEYSKTQVKIALVLHPFIWIVYFPTLISPYSENLSWMSSSCASSWIPVTKRIHPSILLCGPGSPSSVSSILSYSPSWVTK